MAATLLATVMASVPARAEEPIPLLISVDDLPMAGGLNPDVETRRRLTDEMLATLAKHQVPAVGLVTWGNMRPGDEALLESWLDAGHELGNHSTAHLSYTATEFPAYFADIESARQEINRFLVAQSESLGKHTQSQRAVRFFRFPMLREGDTAAKLNAMREYLADSGQRNLPVTLDTQDWSFERPWLAAVRSGDKKRQQAVAEAYHESLHLSIRHQEQLARRLFERPVAQILLLHANAVGAAQWDRLFTWLKDQGYRFASADEVLADPAFAEQHAYVGTHGPGLWHRLRAERQTGEIADEVKAFLLEQADAWNRGDLETFTRSYAEDARFVSPSGLTLGRAEVLARYQRRYPDRSAMGHLTFEFHHVGLHSGTEVSLLGDAVPSRVHGATVVAKWMLGYPDDAERDDASGLTLIVLRRSLNGAWEITEDASM
ncbi:MAG: polysaccharide deacetylase family protein [Acidobacteriota bacterium]